ncbi:hypothetical protein GCM10025331_51350 [Actinoplanes utahensis]|nr:hypothetical protein Aut01nite_65630 [Actinoplanes utahensis]
MRRHVATGPRWADVLETIAAERAGLTEDAAVNDCRKRPGPRPCGLCPRRPVRPADRTDRQTDGPLSQNAGFLSYRECGSTGNR